MSKSKSSCYKKNQPCKKMLFRTSTHLTTIGKCLNAKLPLRVHTLVDCFIQILAMEIWILPRKLQSFVPHQRMDAKGRSKVKLYKMTDAVLVDQSKRVNTKPLHHAEASWYTTVRHSPHEHVRSFGVQVLEIPKIVMCALSLRNFPVWLRFDRMHCSQNLVRRERLNG